MKGPVARRAAGLTLVELLLASAILAVLISLVIPAMEPVFEKARSARCAGNLRSLGVSVRLAVADNDNRFPKIETDPTNPIYDPVEGVKPLLEALRPYGATEQVVQCPADLRARNYFKQKGSSYEWRPLFDDEPANDPKLYFGGRAISVPPNRIRLIMDFDALHGGRQNLLYADGRVRSF